MKMPGKIKRFFAPRCARLDAEIANIKADADEALADAEQTITHAETTRCHAPRLCLLGPPPSPEKVTR